MEEAAGGHPRDRERRIFAWEYPDIAERTDIFLPGEVAEIGPASIPHLVPGFVTRDAAGTTVLVQLAQAEADAHLALSKEVEAIRTRGAIRNFGMHVTSPAPFGKVIASARTEQEDDGRGGDPVAGMEARFWVRAEGAEDPVKLPPIRMQAQARRYDGGIEFGRAKDRGTFGPLLACPEWWCLIPWCHSHWYWWPGVGGTTVCGGGCIIGGPCQCLETTLIPPTKMGTCSGLTFCWC